MGFFGSGSIGGKITESDLPSTVKEKLVKVNEIGDLSQLQTKNKSSLTAATNEITMKTSESASILEIKKEVKINIKQPPFNAKGTPGIDDSDAIQAAINYAFRLGDSYFPIIEFGAGIFEITKPLYHNQSGNYADVLGAGIRQTRLKATAPMPCMLYVSDVNGVHTRKRISGITFDGNGMADCLLDGSYLRYSTIELNEFIRAKDGGWAIKLSNWVTRFLNNTINGQDLTGTSTPCSNGLLLQNEAMNNFVIQNNSFTSCLVGIQCNANPHDLSINQNTFDKCLNAGIWLKLGGRKVAILDNYFEACGHNGVDVEIAKGVFEKWYGAIIGHGIYTSPANTTFESLSIFYNEFASCSPRTIISLANLDSFHIENNHALKQYTSTYFVELRWNGVTYSSGRKAIIDHSSYVGQFTQLVGLNGQDKRFHHAGLQIIDRKLQFYNIVEKLGYELTNLSNWPILAGSANWTVTNDGYLDSIFPISKVKATSANKDFTVNLADSKGIRGQYFNCNVLAKGSPGAPNGLWIKVEADGSILLDTNVIGEVWLNSFRNATFYVPETSNQLKIYIRPVYSNSDVWFTKFNISNASIPMERKRFLTHDL